MALLRSLYIGIASIVTGSTCTSAQPFSDHLQLIVRHLDDFQKDKLADPLRNALDIELVVPQVELLELLEHYELALLCIKHSDLVPRQNQRLQMRPATNARADLVDLITAEVAPLEVVKHQDWFRLRSRERIIAEVSEGLSVLSSSSSLLDRYGREEMALWQP